MGDANYVVVSYTTDNHWNSQKLSTEKSTVGNDPYIKRVTVEVALFVFNKASRLVNKRRFSDRCQSRKVFSPNGYATWDSIWIFDNIINLNSETRKIQLLYHRNDRSKYNLYKL